MSPFLTDEVSPELSLELSPELSPSPSQGKTYSPERLTIEEPVNARMLWVLDAQRQVINEPKFEQRTADLGLVQGNDSSVCCHGRLGKSGLSEDAKRPNLLPGKHPLTNVIIQQCHKIVGHAGMARTLVGLPC